MAKWSESRHEPCVLEPRLGVLDAAAIVVSNVIGGGIFALQYGDYAGRRDALTLTKRANAGSFSGWLLIGEDDPHLSGNIARALRLENVTKIFTPPRGDHSNLSNSIIGNQNTRPATTEAALCPKDRI